MTNNEDERTKGLEEFFKHVYKCGKCERPYGSDRIEKAPHLCPFCEGKFK